MIISHNCTPSDIVKTAILAKLYNTSFQYVRSSFLDINDSNLIDVSKYELENVISLYEQKHGPVHWLQSSYYTDLCTVLRHGLRYTAKDNFEVSVITFMQSLEMGPEYVFSRVSKEARTIFQRAGSVCKEAHRAYGFVRLNPIQTILGEVMVGKVKFQHNIYDIVLRYFTRRLTKTPIYLIEENTAYSLSNNKLISSSVQDLPFTLQTDNFSELWEAFYDSQFIEQRKNLALAKKHIPKKYWSWMPETKNFK